ncbi:hypothetical protein CDD81_2960 [Ophiocordyceps australis]|uniref:Uncharacterized protein n=1 Tax=Ophiocordyceps australis TaxID=1399860 RepID=A0A2C5YJT9_9HYPO|nr:hypothetical protein CDD81_2960 [Ophiocordyceps australis]
MSIARPALQPGTHQLPPLTLASTPPVSTEKLQPLATPSVQTATGRNHGAFPPMTTHWTKPKAYGKTGVFSPATCPNGWFTATIQVNTDQNDLSKSTTTAVCCSSYYSFDGFQCKRSMPMVLAVPMTYYFESSPSYQVFPSSTTTLYSAAMAVYAIRALFREEDKQLLGLVDDDDIAEDETHDRSLSTGARAGIALAVTAVAVLLTGAIAFCLLHSRKRRRRRAKCGNGSHELTNVDTRTARGPIACMPHAMTLDTREAIVTEPPPAYEASTATDSDEHGEDMSEARQNEIRALVAQKVAIQQRIEELERVGGEPCAAQI